MSRYLFLCFILIQYITLSEVKSADTFYAFNGGGPWFGYSVAGAGGNDKVKLISDQYGGPVLYVDTSGNDTTGNGSVGNPYATIQAGINAASNGDTVLVRSGTYYENNISTHGKSIYVKSEYGPATTTVFAEYGGDGFHIVNTAEDSSTIIEGFTIISATYGVYLVDAAPTLRNLIITSSQTAGIYARMYTYNTLLIVEACTISCAIGIDYEGHPMIGGLSVNSSVINGSGRTTTGIFVGMSEAPIEVRNTTITQHGYGISGGTSQLVARLIGCTFSDNDVSIDLPYPIITKCDILNSRVAVSGWNTFGPECSVDSSTITGITGLVFEAFCILSISESIISNNPGQLGNIACDGGSLSITNSVLMNNGAFPALGSYGFQTFAMTGSVYANNASPIIFGPLNSFAIRNSTIVGNNIGGIDYGVASGAIDNITNSVIAFNNGFGIRDGFAGAPVTSPYLHVECNDVFGNTGGDFVGVNSVNEYINNISFDPLFCDTANGNYSLNACSPSAPGNNVCSTLIGALPVQCSTIYCGPVWYVDTAGNDTTGNGSAGSPFATIQAGINSSSNGDTVLVRSGTYWEENISTNGKSIYVKSENGPAVTTIALEFGRGFNIVNTGEDSLTVVDGFTINGGEYGVYLVNAAPILRNLVIANSLFAGISATMDTLALPLFIDSCVTTCPVGIDLQRGDYFTPLSLQVERSAFYGSGRTTTGISTSGTLSQIVVRNTKFTQHAYGIIGVTTPSSSEDQITGCTFADNDVSISIPYPFSIKKCDISNCRIAITGDGPERECILDSSIVTNVSGLIFENFCDLQINESIIRNCPGSFGSIGCGSANLWITNSTLNNNGPFPTLQYQAFNIFRFIRSVYSNNTSTINLGIMRRFRIENSTIVGNDTGGIKLESLPYGGIDTIVNTIIAFNNGYGFKDVSSVLPRTSPYLHVECNDVYGNAGSDFDGINPVNEYINNISLDPFFCNESLGDYHLYDVSPCLPTNNSCSLLIGALGSECVSGYTPVGQNVKVPVVSNDSSIVIVTFDNVETAGSITVTDTTGIIAKSGFIYVPSSPAKQYDISTDVGTNDSMTVCFNYEDAWIQGNESDLQLMHASPGWDSVRVSLDTANNIICGRVNGLSPFALMEPGCCVGLTGNVDNDPADIVDITDLTVLIDHLFINFPPLACPAEGNVDGDAAGLVDITDLTFLIDHLFINFPPTAECQ